MKLSVTLGLVFFGLAATLAPARAASPLPSGAVTLASIRLSGYANGFAVAYRTEKPYLGVIQRGRLVWHLSLPAQPKRVFAGERAGLFGAIVQTTSPARFYGFRLHAGTVTSGIEGSASGMVTGDVGVHRIGAVTLVSNRDTTHQGSVHYRTVAHYVGCSRLFCLQSTTRQPDYKAADYPRPNAVIKTAHGDTILIRLEVASTDAEREQGLMGRPSLDPDSGMIFVWSTMTTESFWMHDTLIPLTVAFLAPDGTILETQDMQKLSDDLHTPQEPYRYAIEVNQGFFARAGVKVGDRVRLTLTQ
jgi:uncharacterized membrane protein (UPF0127 family)